MGSSFLQLLQCWSYRALRLLLWAVAVGYLVLEAREVAAQRQLTQITVFAVLFLVASFQMGVARFLAQCSEPLWARGTLHASLAMFTASLFSVLDGAFDFLFASLQGVAASPFLPLLYLLGWGVNLLSVVLARASMETFLRILQRLAIQP